MKGCSNLKFSLPRVMNNFDAFLGFEQLLGSSLIQEKYQSCSLPYPKCAFYQNETNEGLSSFMFLMDL
jgi:hypothetical protein